MEKMIRFNLWGIPAMACMLMMSSIGHGYEINEMLSIGGVIAGGGQYMSVSDAPGYDNTSKGAMPIQPEISFTPTQDDEVFIKIGFAAGNGLNAEGVSPFSLSLWNVDMEDDVKNINGRNRDTLLTAWYRHTFRFDEDHKLGFSFGIVDSTNYIDQNEYANCGFNQFMNQAFVNAPVGFAPSYDAGGAFEWEFSGFSLNGVGMNVGENDAGNSYNFYGVQAGYTLETDWGKGNYRVTVEATNDEFPDPLGENLESQMAYVLSCDQQFGEVVGAWIRMGWQDDNAAITHKDMYSGGFDIKGSFWDRPEDNIGIGYGHLTGGNLDVDKTDVFEIYYRVAINKILAVTGDFQYVTDTLKEGDSPSGQVYGIRLTATF